MVQGDLSTALSVSCGPGAQHRVFPAVGWWQQGGHMQSLPGLHRVLGAAGAEVRGQPGCSITTGTPQITFSEHLHLQLENSGQMLLCIG